MRITLERQLEVIRAALGSVESTLEGLCQGADAYLDFCIENPATVALWTHRSLHDASDIQDLEKQYILPGRELVYQAIKEQHMRTAPELLMATIVWCVHGFVTRGMYDRDGSLVGIDDPFAVARMREHLRQLIRLMYGQG